MATRPWWKAASSCNEPRRWSIREALPAGAFCLLLASLALLHDGGKHTNDASVPPTPKVARGESVVPDAAWSPLVNGTRIPASTSFERPVEPIDARPSLGLLRLSLTDSDATVRLRAVTALADIDDERAGNMLAAALYDQDSAVRQEAVAVLSERRRAADLQTLKQALTDPDDGVREAAIGAFVTIGGGESARALGALIHTGDVSSRLLAVDALGAIGGEIATASLRAALNDENDAVRTSAAELLREPPQGAEQGQ